MNGQRAVMCGRPDERRTQVGPAHRRPLARTSAAAKIGALCGWSPCRAPETGDLNRDGIPDLIMNTVQAPYVLSGSTSLATDHTMRRLSPPDTDQPDVQAALVGDVDGDGKADVLTGGPTEDIGTATDTGSVWITYGGTTTLGSSHDQMFSQATAGVPGTAASSGFFGKNVGLLDLNKDGKADPVISAPHEQGLVLLTGTASGVTTTGARELKPVGDSGDYPLPVSG